MNIPLAESHKQTNWIKLLDDFQKVPKDRRNSTFFEIAGFPHYETVSSNILRFFLNPLEEHGFKDLVLKSLLSLAGFENAWDELSPEIEVVREMITSEQKRIDIFIQTDKYAICIENKLFANLHNDLGHYRKTTLGACKGNPSREPVNVILSLRKLNPIESQKAAKHQFKSITYEALFSKIKENIGNYLTEFNSKHVILLTDFMTSITRLTQGYQLNKQMEKFFKDNDSAIQNLIGEYTAYKRKLQTRLDELKNLLPIDEVSKEITKQWIYKKDYDICLVHDFVIGNYTISTDTWISPEGWQIQLFARGTSEARDFLNDVMCGERNVLAKPVETYDRHGSRIVIAKYDLQTPLDILVDTHKDILGRIGKFKSDYKETTTVLQ